MSITAAEFKEYDRFGPWIDEVAGPDDVPKLFRTFPIDFGATRLVLKVPRNIARRNVSAGMNLYDHLVILDQDSLTLLSRHVATVIRGKAAAGGPAFDVFTALLDDVVAIRDDLDLLDGRLTVSTSSGDTVAVHYNGSARDTATRLVNELRAGICSGPASGIGKALLVTGNAGADVTALPDPGYADTHLVTRTLELREDYPDLVTWASHGSRRLTPVVPGLRGTASRVAHAISPMTLHGAAVLADAKAMEVLGRHASLVRGRGPVYSSSRLVVPFDAIDRLALAPHPLYPATTLVTIGSGAWSTEIAVPRDSETERLFRAASQRG